MPTSTSLRWWRLLLLFSATTTAFLHQRVVVASQGGRQSGRPAEQQVPPSSASSSSAGAAAAAAAAADGLGLAGWRLGSRSNRRRLLLAGGVAAAGGLTVLASSGGGSDFREPRQAMSTIDGHLHIWSDGKAPYPWAEGNEPPSSPRLGDDRATVESLLAKMDHAVVAGALVVQPITHKFDHSYVRDAIKKHPDRLKGMCLANPAIEGGAAAAGE
jgi:hypothetical protein